MHDDEDVTANSGVLPTCASADAVAFQAVIDTWLSERAASVDSQAERAWLIHEAEKPESEESRRKPGAIAVHDRHTQLLAIADDERTNPERMELQDTAEIAELVGAFPSWLKSRRRILGGYVPGPATPVSAARSHTRETRAFRRPREHRAGRASRARAPAGSDDPHERQKPGNRAQLVNCIDEILVLFVEQHTDRVSVTCGYCGACKRGTRRTLLDREDVPGWWSAHECVPPVAARFRPFVQVAA